MRTNKPITRPEPMPIFADAIYSKRCFCAAFQWENRTWSHAVKAGLSVISFGKQKFILGADALAFFQRLGEEQNGGGNGNQTEEKHEHERDTTIAAERVFLRDV